jgi:hypothetical protein
MKQVIDRDNPIGTKYDGTTIYSTKEEIDPRYISACVELNDYTPISFDEMEIKIQKQFDECHYAPVSKAWGNGSGPG